MLTITISIVFLINGVFSSRINFFFPKTECPLYKYNSRMIIDRIKLRLSNLDKEYQLILRDEFSEFDYSGGLKNIRLLSDCIKELKAAHNETIVCPAIKDLYLLDYLIQNNEDTLYITDEIINIPFGLSLPSLSDFTNLNYLFNVFHSSVWSILLLISLLMGIYLYIMEILGHLEPNEEKYDRITITEAYYITYLTLWGSTVSKNLKTAAAKIALHIWHIFMVLIIILYIASVVSLVSGTSGAGRNRDPIAEATKVYCSRETETLCHSIIRKYPQQKIDWNICDNSSKIREKGSISVIFGQNSLRNSQNRLKSNIDLNYNSAIVFVSNNITVVREINLKMLRNSIKLFDGIKHNAISYGLIGLPIRLTHIYGPILFLAIGSGFVSLISAATMISRLLSIKIREFRKKKEKPVSVQLNDDERPNETSIEHGSPKNKVGRNQETEKKISGQAFSNPGFPGLQSLVTASSSRRR